MLATDHALPEFTLSARGGRAVARRAAIPALIALGAGSAVLLAGRRLHVIGEALRRVLHADVGWVALALVFECVSLVGYVSLLWLVAGRQTPRIGARVSAQITLAGAAATRLLPTAGAGGAGLTIWALRRAGLSTRAAVRTLLVFFVLLYAVFLTATAGVGAALSLGLGTRHGPMSLSASACGLAVVGIALALLAALRAGDPRKGELDGHGGRRARLRSAAGLLGAGVRDAVTLVRSRDPRLVGGVAYWTFDAAVLWAALTALGSSPSVPVLGLAYFVGQVANTLPIPGSVSGGMAGVLIAFGVPAGVALPGVLAYRTIAVWLPAPVAIGSVRGLRATITGWSRTDAAA